MSVMVWGEDSSTVSCAAKEEKGEQPCVLLVVAHHKEAMQVRLPPYQAMALGKALIEDAQSVLMIRPFVGEEG